MAFTRAGGLITVAVGKIPSSISNFTALISTANMPIGSVDGGVNSILNGGGNLRCYTDKTKTTQLSVEIVTFVTGVTPDIQVWVLSPALQDGDTVYIEADTVETTQPAVTAPFGRNSVWVNNNASWHMDEINPTDVSGNGFDGTSTNCQLSTGKIGNSIERLTTSNRITSAIGNLLLSTQPFTIQGWIKFNARSGSAVIYQFDTDLSTGFQLFEISNVSYGDLNFGSNSNWAKFAINTSIVLGQYHHVVVTYDGVNPTLTSSFSVYFDGVSQTLVTNAAYGVVPNENGFLGRNDGSFSTDGAVDEQSIDSRVLDSNYITSEYNNQSSPSTFWTVGLWEDQAGGPTFQAAWAKNANVLIQ